MALRSFRSRAALLWALAAFTPPVAGAEKTTKPYKGVVHVHRLEDTQDYHLVLIAPRAMEAVATSPDQAWSAVSDFARKVGARIAVNANFFSKTESCGVTAGDSRLWTAVYEGNCGMTVAFFRSGAAAIVQGKVRKDGTLSPTVGLVAAVSGRPRLIENGEAVPPAEAFMKVRHPRTAIGLKADGTLVLLVADGRRPAALGFTGPELTEILLKEAVKDAINLDGGGSSTLFIEAEGGVQNKPSDGHERVVVNHLGFRPRSKDARDR